MTPDLIAEALRAYRQQLLVWLGSWAAWGDPEYNDASAGHLLERLRACEFALEDRARLGALAARAAKALERREAKP